MNRQEAAGLIVIGLGLLLMLMVGFIAGWLLGGLLP